MALEAANRRLELRAHVAVERTVVEARPREQELEDGDVEPEVAGPDRPLAEERPPERAERVSCAGRDLAGHRQVRAALGPVDRGARQRPDVAVDGAEVEAERAQRDLNAGLLRARRRLTGQDEDTGQKRNSDEPPRTHSRLVFSALTWFPAGVHPTAAKVQERLADRGLTVEVQVLPDSTRTAAEAAAACGCEIGQIVKSLVFVIGGEPTMVLCAGDRRVTQVDGRPASADEARAATGFAIGGFRRSGTTGSCRRSSTSRCDSSGSGVRPARPTPSSRRVDALVAAMPGARSTRLATRR